MTTVGTNNATTLETTTAISPPYQTQDDGIISQILLFFLLATAAIVLAVGVSYLTKTCLAKKDRKKHKKLKAKGLDHISVMEADIPTVPIPIGKHFQPNLHNGLFDVAIIIQSPITPRTIRRFDDDNDIAFETDAQNHVTQNKEPVAGSSGTPEKGVSMNIFDYTRLEITQVKPAEKGQPSGEAISEGYAESTLTFANPAATQQSEIVEGTPKPAKPKVSFKIDDGRGKI